jgi:copper chaperone
MRRVTVHITGMSCGHCMYAVNQALASQPGIQLESLRMGRALVRYDEGMTSPSKIESLINDAGYSARAEPLESDQAEERV